MKTLIIHPKDKSTDFLTEIYKDIPNKKVVTGGLTKREIGELIQTHDRVIMCGHGTPNGLLSVGQFKTKFSYIIDYSFVHLLKQKTENIFIWCNADRFVNRYNLKGFYSGMFVSEVGESNYCNIPSTFVEVTESNETFSKLMSECVNESVDVIYNKIKNDYGKFSLNNKVGYYNNERLYLNI